MAALTAAGSGLYAALTVVAVRSGASVGVCRSQSGDAPAAVVALFVTLLGNVVAGVVLLVSRPFRSGPERAVRSRALGAPTRGPFASGPRCDGHAE